MIAEIIPECYDAVGKKTFRPDSRRHSGFRPTFPFGLYARAPLKHWCADFSELRKTLLQFTYISDQELYDKPDYWQSPDKFEEIKKGDCEDYALWAWRQLLQMNLPARFVMGRAGHYGEGHAWVTFQKDGKDFLLEPLSAALGLTMPRLSAIRYKPRYSVASDGEVISYYAHQEQKSSLPIHRIGSLILEWLWFWLRFALRLVYLVGRKLLKKSV